MDDFSKIILTGLLWYFCHKYIRKALNTKKWNKWNEDDELDAKLGARPLQRVIDDEIKKPLSKMMLFGELTAGGMVEVGLSNDVVPKLTVNFKAKKAPKVIEQFKPKVSDEKKS